MLTIAEPHTIADELPYLGGMEVIEEVYSLISRLESDRVETEHLLFSEKQKGRTLQRKIDDLANRRAVEFPLAVQTGNYLQEISPMMLHTCESHLNFVAVFIKNTMLQWKI